MKTKKLLAVLLCMEMLAMILPTVSFGAEIVKSGTCGENLTWTLNSEGTLIISGEGDMENWDAYEGAWHFYWLEQSIKNVFIEEGVTSIGSCAFIGCNDLVSVTVPSSVTSIGGWALTNGCDKLASIEVSENNIAYKDIDGVLFNKAATELIQYPAGNTRTSYAIPDSVTSIGEYAFSSCSSLTSITIPDGVTSIGRSAFSFSNLTSIAIPDSVTSIGKYAFDGTTWYNNQPDGLIYAGKVLCGYKGEMPENTTIEIELGTVEIAEGAFLFSSLTSVTIPSSVTSIGESAFFGCRSLTSVTIPDSVKSIGDDAFDGCTSLKDVYYTGSEDDWSKIKIGYSIGSLTDAAIHYNSVSSELEIKVFVNGAPIAFDVPPMITDGTTMIPVRLALEPLGAKFVWNDEDQTVTITDKGTTIVLTVGSNAAMVNGTQKTMLKPVIVINGRTLIPVRFVAEALGYDVRWNEETKTVTIQ